MKKLTLSNIRDFLQGSVNHFLAEYDLLPSHQKEQGDLRLASSNPECIEKGSCVECGCKVPHMMYAPYKKCNRCGWGPMLNDIEWEKKKKLTDEQVLSEEQKPNKDLPQGPDNDLHGSSKGL